MPKSSTRTEGDQVKICISASTGNLDSQVDPRFGRCPYFVIVDSETMEFEAIPNRAAGATGGAGIQAAQTVANKGARVVVTGNIGPNAFQALSNLGIKIVVGASGNIRKAVEAYKKGELNEAKTSTVRSHFGTNT